MMVYDESAHEPPVIMGGEETERRAASVFWPVLICGAFVLAAVFVAAAMGVIR